MTSQKSAIFHLFPPAHADPLLRCTVADAARSSFLFWQSAPFFRKCRTNELPERTEEI